MTAVIIDDEKLLYKYLVSFGLKHKVKLYSAYDEIFEKIQKEMRYFNLSLLPPHLLKSELDFSIEDNNIRMGLLCVKGFSEKSVEKLNKFRQYIHIIIRRYSTTTDEV